ncbi:MAG TPA: HTTM domain-containing protein [Polyangiaceae bacterium]|nr:HTTM domain-containing protein [Polyangiaceae bacterium]
MLPGVREITSLVDKPVSIVRLEIVRIAAPLAILGFMSPRLAHADEWLGDAGFRVPDLGGDWRQPLFLPALPSGLAWAVAVVMAASGLACAIGWRARTNALIFAATLMYAALADRLASFTVSKLSPVVILAVAAGPAGTLLSVDARRNRGGGGGRETMQSSGAVRFLQMLPVVIYSASGIAKAKGDWLKVPLVLWSHVHDSYQTPLAFALASILPAWAWTVSQGLVLAFELLAPLWFGLARTRPYALAFGLSMHAMIGLMFGPVRWFALLMMTLLFAGYAPQRIVTALEAAADRFGGRRAATSS